MKKILALLLALCLSLCVVSALADRVAYELDDFILTTDARDLDEAALTIQEKAVGVTFMVYYPLATQGDVESNINATWAQTYGMTMNGEELRETIVDLKEAMVAEFEAQGLTVNSFDIGDGRDVEYWGFACAECDYSLNVSYAGQTVSAAMRQIAVPYCEDSYMIFTITAFEAETLDVLTEQLIADLQWK